MNQITEPKKYKGNKDGNYPDATQFSIGIDLGGTNLRATALTPDGKRLRSQSIPTRVLDGPQAVLTDMARMVDDMVEEFVPLYSFFGVGIGSPGPLVLPSGTLLQPPNLQGFHNFDLKKQFERLTGLSVIIESDANAAAVAEWKFGAGKTSATNSLCFITLGTGVGSGIILDGQIWHGAKGMSGEIGHSPIWPDGITCSCGGKGCLERYASATAIKQFALERHLSLKCNLKNDEEITAKTVVDLAQAGDIDALAILHTASHALGIGIANLVNTLNLPLIVLGGGVSNAWEMMRPDVLESLCRYSYVYRLSKPDDVLKFEPEKTNICRAELGEDAGLIGAALLPFLKLVEPSI